MNEDVRAKLRYLPDAPGVYIFKDSEGATLYVGKAGSLKNRVRSYFQSGKGISPKTGLMVKKIAKLEIVTTANEVEALILEQNYIKKYKPHYNVLMRDDKSYPYIAITVKDEFPTIFYTRRLDIESARYFGPYASPFALKQTLDTLMKLFPLRSCPGRKPGKGSGSPCLNYQIGRCLAPCIGKVSREDYEKIVDEVVSFLSGRGEKVLKRLEAEMLELAEARQFEKAALLRDRLAAAREVLQKQKVVLEKKSDFNIIGAYEGDSEVYLANLLVRGGKLIGSRGYVFNSASVKESLLMLLDRLFLEEEVPPEIIIPAALTDAEIKNLPKRAPFDSAPFDKAQGRQGDLRKRDSTNIKTRLIYPVRGEKRDLLKIATQNAAHSYLLLKMRSLPAAEALANQLKGIKEKLGLSRIPYRIECFDISNLSGREAVASMVVFEDGRPKKQAYRRFKIMGKEEPDDFMMMYEAVKRRLVNLKEGDPKFKVKPDLIMVDGGKPQLSAALTAYQEVEPGEIDFASLAKKEELFFTPGAKDGVSLAKNPELQKLLQQVRDESHRFAVAYHRQLRSKKIRASALDDIPGLGPARKQKLIKHFGSAKKVMAAPLEELQKVVPKKVAEKILDSANAPLE